MCLRGETIDADGTGAERKGNQENRKITGEKNSWDHGGKQEKLLWGMRSLYCGIGRGEGIPWGCRSKAEVYDILQGKVLKEKCLSSRNESLWLVGMTIPYKSQRWKDVFSMEDFVDVLSGTAHERLSSAMQERGAFWRFILSNFFKKLIESYPWTGKGICLKGSLSKITDCISCA